MKKVLVCALIVGILGTVFGYPAAFAAAPELSDASYNWELYKATEFEDVRHIEKNNAKTGARELTNENYPRVGDKAGGAFLTNDGMIFNNPLAKLTWIVVANYEVDADANGKKIDHTLTGTRQEYNASTGYMQDAGLGVWHDKNDTSYYIDGDVSKGLDPSLSLFENLGTDQCYKVSFEIAPYGLLETATDNSVELIVGMTKYPDSIDYAAFTGKLKSTSVTVAKKAGTDITQEDYQTVTYYINNLNSADASPVKARGLVIRTNVSKFHKDSMRLTSQGTPAFGFAIRSFKIEKGTKKTATEEAKLRNFGHDSQTHVYTYDPQYTSGTWGPSIGTISFLPYNWSGQYGYKDGNEPYKAILAYKAMESNATSSSNTGFAIVDLPFDFTEENYGEIWSVTFQIKAENFKVTTDNAVDLYVGTITGYDRATTDNSVRINSLTNFANKQKYTLKGFADDSFNGYTNIVYSFTVSQETRDVKGFRAQFDMDSLWTTDANGDKTSPLNSDVLKYRVHRDITVTRTPASEVGLKTIDNGYMVYDADGRYAAGDVIIGAYENKLLKSVAVGKINNYMFVKTGAGDSVKTFIFRDMQSLRPMLLTPMTCAVPVSE